MINTEKVFDILPYVSDIYEKIGIKEYIETKSKAIKKNKQTQEDVKSLGLDMFSYIMKQSPKIKDEFFNIVAIIDEKDIEEIKKQSLAETIKTMKALFEDIETMDFFKSAMG